MYFPHTDGSYESVKSFRRATDANTDVPDNPCVFPDHTEQKGHARCQHGIKPLCPGLETTFAGLSSPVSHLLNSNKLPSSAETSLIWSTLSEIQEISSHVKANIDILERSLKHLRNKEDELRNLAKDHRALLSPARRLFPELWSHIFIQCLPENTLEYHINRRRGNKGSNRLSDTSSSDAPLLLIQVCSQWRSIALSTPQLWANLTYTVCRPSAIKVQLKRMETWLARSGAAPLSVVVFRSHFDANNHLNHPYLSIPDQIPPLRDDRVFRFILDHSHRWTNAELLLPAAEAAEAIVPVKNNLPNLKRLTFGLFWNDAGLGSSHEPQVDAFETAQGLEEVTLVEQTKLQVSLPNFDGSRLTTLSIEGLVPSGDALAMLYRYPHLYSCNLNVMITTSPPSTGSLPIHDCGPLRLRSLALNLSGMSIHVYGHFLRYLNVPNLIELRLKSYRWFHDQLLLFLKQFPQSSSFETFELSSPTLTPEELVVCLQSPLFRNIRTLIVGEGTYKHVPFSPTQEPFSTMFESREFIPRLRTIHWTCFGRGVDSCDSVRLTSMLTSRLGPKRNNERGAEQSLREFILTLNKGWGEGTVNSRGTFGSESIMASLGVHLEVRIGRF